MSSRYSLALILTTLCLLASAVRSEQPPRRNFYQVQERKVNQQLRRAAETSTLTFSGDVESIIELANNRAQQRGDEGTNQGDAVVVVSGPGDEGDDSDPFVVDNTETAHIAAKGSDCPSAPAAPPSPSPVSPVSPVAGPTTTTDGLPIPPAATPVSQNAVNPTTTPQSVAITPTDSPQGITVPFPFPTPQPTSVPVILPATPGPTVAPVAPHTPATTTEAPTKMPVPMQEPTTLQGPTAESEPSSPSSETTATPATPEPITEEPVSMPESNELIAPTVIVPELPVVAGEADTIDGSQGGPSTTSSGSDTGPTPNAAPTGQTPPTAANDVSENVPSLSDSTPTPGLSPTGDEPTPDNTPMSNGSEGASGPAVTTQPVLPPTAPPVVLPTSPPVAPQQTTPKPVAAPVQPPTTQSPPTNAQPVSAPSNIGAVTATPTTSALNENVHLSPTMHSNVATEPTTSENQEAKPSQNPTSGSANDSAGTEPTASSPTSNGQPSVNMPTSSTPTSSNGLPTAPSPTMPTSASSPTSSNGRPTATMPTTTPPPANGDEETTHEQVESATSAPVDEETTHEQVESAPSAPVDDGIGGAPTTPASSSPPVLAPALQSGPTANGEPTLVSPSSTFVVAPTMHAALNGDGEPSVPDSNGEGENDSTVNSPSSAQIPGDFMSPSAGSNPELIQETDSTSDGSSPTVTVDAPTGNSPVGAPSSIPPVGVPANTVVACDDSALERDETIEFTYSLETSSNDFGLIESIRKSTELALSRDIANLLLPCDVRRLQADDSLGFEGIDHLPEDTISGKDCDATVDIKNDCTVFDGILRIYISQETDFELAKYYTLTAIREALGLIDGQVDGLARASYLGPDIVNPSAFGASDIGPGEFAPGPSNLNTSLVLFAVGGCAFAASVGLIYYLRRHGTYSSSGAATQAAGSDQHTGRMDADRPLSPFSEMLPSAYRFDQDGNMSAILELDDESATQRSGIVVSDSGFTTEEEGSIAISMDGTASLNRLDSPVLGARKRHDESMDSLLELL